MKNTKVEKGFKLEIKKTNIMNKSSKRGIFLAIGILFSISLLLIPSNGYAEEINVKSTGVEKTSIITLTNDAAKEIKTFRIWLGQDSNFESFKTEKGWIGEKTPQGVIIFTSSQPIKENESVKFGIKTDKANPIINWKGLDQTNSVIDTGVVASKKLEKINPNPDLESNKNIKNSDGEIFLDSSFRIIPDKPNSGSTIRVTGDNFDASQFYDFYMDTKKIGSFETDNKGHFITTMKIPKTESKDRVDFKIKNNQGEEKVVSLRLGSNENRITQFNEIKISINGINNIVHRGDILEISGTATPGTAIITEIKDPQQNIINSRTAKVDGTGNWKLKNAINISFDAPLGKYSITVSDGRHQHLKVWTVETNKIIIINPEKIKFEPGELIKFTGTALPNNPLELVLEDSLGDEMIADILEIDDSGVVEFEYQTTENDDKEGTWTLIATQKNIKEFIYVGYDEMPTTPVNLEFDKSNYVSTDTAIISVIGKPSDKITLIIITPSGNVQGADKIIELREDGRGEYNLDLTGYVSGIYTAVAKKSGSQSSERFSVGLQLGSGPIDANTTHTEYQQGERILLLGSTKPNTLMTATLVDPNERKVKTVEIASNSEGVFTEERLRIPSSGEPGLWTINVASGSNLDTVEFNVFSSIIEAMTVKTSDEVKVGDLLTISITASHKTSIIIKIIDMDGQEVDDLGCNTTKEFFCETFWSVPKNTVPGTYMIKVNDAISSNETLFEIKKK
jgi:hypothetical protein